MKKNIILSSITIVALASLIGCGSSSSGDSSTTGHLVDSAVSGASYSCGDVNGTTDKDGTFTCKSLPVTFFVGSVKLGTISSLPSDGKIYPQDLAGVKRSDTNNTKVKKLAQFLQSLDKDHNASNGITIDSALASKVKKNITDWEGVDMEAYLYDIDSNMNVVSEDDAIKHLGEQFSANHQSSSNGDNSSGSGGSTGGKNLIDTVDAKHVAGYTLKVDDPTNITDHFKTRYYIFKENNKVTIVEDLDDGDQIVNEAIYTIKDSIKGAYSIDARYVNKAGIESSYIILLTDDYYFKQISPKLPLTVMPNDKNGVVIKHNNPQPNSSSVVTVKNVDDLKGYTFISSESITGSGAFTAHQTIEFKVNCDGSYKETIDTHLTGQTATPTINEGTSEDISIDSDSVTIGEDSIYLDSNQQIIAGKSCISSNGKLGKSCQNGLYIESIKKDTCN